MNFSISDPLGNLLRKKNETHCNLNPVILLENAIRNQEGVLSATGAFVVNTGFYTGRSPKDKFFVDTGINDIWWGEINQPVPPSVYDQLLDQMIDHLRKRTIYQQDLRAGSDPRSAINLNIITEKAWSALFSHNLFVRPKDSTEADPVTDPFTIIHCPEFTAPQGTQGLDSQTFIIINLEKRVILVGGTAYAGEVKKSVFSVMNYLLPKKGILSMHCSASLGDKEDVALFFGLSGTGKTTLSSDPERRLIGDDEHGWSDEGIFNIEGGCYAKTIHLSELLEPIIWQAAQRIFTVLENVVLDDQTRQPNFDDATLTENTRAAYPIEYVDGHVDSGMGGHPRNIFFLSADASGVLPPISRLNASQALYYFLSGYTSKLAGTELGIGRQPEATFSACFGEPFLPLHPKVYCNLLAENLYRHPVNVWLINTGWSGGPYGIGKRIQLPYTRAMVNSAISGKLDDVAFHPDGYFGLSIPDTCPGVPNEILKPINTWQNPQDYHDHAIRLSQRFRENYEKYQDFIQEENTRGWVSTRKIK